MARAITKEVKEQRGLSWFDRDKVFLKGSREYIERTIYIDREGRLWIEFYEQIIEVTRGNFGVFATVEAY